jgi:predicted amidohydrolase
VDLIATQLIDCESAGVELLCCPEAIIGGLAHESAGQSPHDVALTVDEMRRLVAPLASSPVASVIGFTERESDGAVYSSAVLLSDGDVRTVYRKVYPGYRTVVSAGTDLPVVALGDTPLGMMICNDIWYVEPARVLAAKGAALIAVPTNSGHVKVDASTSRLRQRGETLPIARAVENTVTLVVADVVGEQGGRQALGCSRIVDPDGAVLAQPPPGETALLIADVEPRRRAHDPRGWDGHLNPDVSSEYAALLDPP